MNWLTEPGVPAGQRNAPVDRARVLLPIFERYEDRWDLLHVDEPDVPVLLPPDYREYAVDTRVGLPAVARVAHVDAELVIPPVRTRLIGTVTAAPAGDSPRSSRRLPLGSL